ncbi:universal stress protein [Modestobacter marinus]|uniref:universal stress protein n=1 Tax=Modestobacter marinus TaxID=477641 RepID=UPI001C958A91|nr:universal stress protein [Modestobacter marinus]
MSSRFPAVVAGVDGYDLAAAAAAAATAVARRRLLPVRLVRAFDRPVPSPGAGPVPPGREAARRAALAALGDLRETLLRQYPGGQITTALVEGTAAEVLLEETASAELLVLGPHGAAPSSGVLGRVRVEVVRRAPCPVLCAAVPSGRVVDGPVVALVDPRDAATSSRLLSTALLEATTRGSDLEVVDLSRTGGPVGPAGTGLAAAVERMGRAAPGVRIRCRRPDDPSGRHLGPAERGAQLLVVGRGDPAGALPPVLRAVLSQAGVPVLLVPPAAAPLARAPVLALSLAPGRAGDPDRRPERSDLSPTDRSEYGR